MCSALFTGILRLRQHEIKDHGLLLYACQYCAKRLTTKLTTICMRRRYTVGRTRHCDICGKGYVGVSMLKTHRITHFEKTLICDICGKSFYDASHLTRHKLVHQDVPPYQCATCGRGFTQIANLRSHRTVHSGERQLCSLCGKTYRCPKNHIFNKHANELPNGDTSTTCLACGKKCLNQSQLRVHQWTHIDEKQFCCDVCGKSYHLKELLRDHHYTHSIENH